MNTRLQEIIKYKTGGRQTDFAHLLNWTPPYLTKLLKGENFGLRPVLSIIETFPEINARWFLTGEGKMLNEEKETELRKKAFEHVQQVIELERFISVMTPEEIREFELVITRRKKACFSPDILSEWEKRMNEQEKEINLNENK